MKKLIAIIALMGAFTFTTPKTANARCVTLTVLCSDGSIAGYAVCCSASDYLVFKELLC
jgi:hypothetical protein